MHEFPIFTVENNLALSPEDYRQSFCSVKEKYFDGAKELDYLGFIKEIYDAYKEDNKNAKALIILSKTTYNIISYFIIFKQISVPSFSLLSSPAFGVVGDFMGIPICASPEYDGSDIFLVSFHGKFFSIREFHIHKPIRHKQIRIYSISSALNTTLKSIFIFNGGKDYSSFKETINGKYNFFC